MAGNFGKIYARSCLSGLCCKHLKLKSQFFSFKFSKITQNVEESEHLRRYNRSNQSSSRRNWLCGLRWVRRCNQLKFGKFSNSPLERLHQRCNWTLQRGCKGTWRAFFNDSNLHNEISNIDCNWKGFSSVDDVQIGEGRCKCEFSWRWGVAVAIKNGNSIWLRYILHRWNKIVLKLKLIRLLTLLYSAKIYNASVSGLFILLSIDEYNTCFSNINMIPCVNLYQFALFMSPKFVSTHHIFRLTMTLEFVDGVIWLYSFSAFSSREEIVQDDIQKNSHTLPTHPLLSYSYTMYRSEKIIELS